MKATRGTLILLLLAGLTLGGCDLLKQIPNPFAPAEEQAAEHPPKPGEEAGKEAGAHEEAGKEESQGAALEPDMEEFPFEELEIATLDGVLLHGRLYDPYQLSESEEEPSRKYPLVVLLHGLNRNQSEWGNLPKLLVEQGMAVLALDQRGHGLSTKNQAGRTVTWRLFEERDWKMMPQDIGRILRFFRQSEEDYPQIDASKIALIGSKLGANVALLAADKYQTQTRAVVLLSPAIEYKDLNVTNAIIQYPNASFIVASQTDPVSFEAAEKLYRWALGPKAIQLYKKGGDGTDMLRNEASLKPDIVKWLKRHLLDGVTPAAHGSASEAPAGKQGHH